MLGAPSAAATAAARAPAVNGDDEPLMKPLQARAPVKAEAEFKGQGVLEPTAVCTACAPPHAARLRTGFGPRSLHSYARLIISLYHLKEMICSARFFISSLALALSSLCSARLARGDARTR